MAPTRSNFERWKSSDEPESWVRKHLQGWNDNEWQVLMASLRKSEYWPLDGATVGQHLEMLREWNLCVADSVKHFRDGRIEEGFALLDRAERLRGVDNTVRFVRAQAFLIQKQPVEAAECLLRVGTAGDDEQVIALKKAAAVALANHAVDFSNKYLGSLNQEMQRNGWDSGYNLEEAHRGARNLKYQTITWLKIASELDPSNLQIIGLIDSYFKIHVTSIYDRELCKR